MRKFTSRTLESIRRFTPWWENIIVDAFDRLEKAWQTEMNYIKEKYGRLDMSWWFDNEECYQISCQLEEDSTHTCIDCWKHLKRQYWWENRRNLWWVLPRCNKCFKAVKDKRALISNK